MKLFILTIIFAILTSLHNLAFSNEKEYPISIKSDSMQYNHKTGTISHHGHVVVTQADKRLKSDELTIIKDKNGEFSKLIAYGNPAQFEGVVDKKASKIIGSAQNISYSPNAKILTLQNNAELKKDGQHFTGPNIVFDLKSSSVTAQRDANSQPTLIIQKNKKL